MEKVALVTGASRGIGRAVAEELARGGVTVVLNYLEKHEQAAATLEGLREQSPESVTIQADVRSKEQVGAMVAQIKERFGRIDVLVNNAGITRDSFFHKMTSEHWDAVLDTNLAGVFNVTREVMPVMRDQRSGRVINISSIVAFSGNMGQTNYCASKAAVVGFTRALALEAAALGITVNAIAPGFMQTAMLEAVPPKVQEKVLENIPMRRFGSPCDVAGVVSFLVSPAADYITGQVLHVNGGLYL
ncbi:MAG: 3-oxoacyl-[acyl-carrier-protein] reductase [Acidobacteriota bacterium]|nr:3-oxoacyl-[acyl-carrier-protein] reductase [Acidobacteriota bacterium]